jgi:hypothetical protein
MTDDASLPHFLSVYNDLDKYPTVGDVAAALGCSVKTIRNKVGLCRSLAKTDATYKVVERGVFNPVPSTEKVERFDAQFTAEDCLAEIRRVAALDPDRVLTRNHFRIHSKISDAVWSQFFGSFSEYRRQAGLELSRQQHAMERAVAKHVSVDHYRHLAAERAEWGDKYVRTAPGRFKTLAVCSDLHDEEIDPFFLRVWLDTVRRAQPDNIVFDGDVYDLPEFGKYTVDPREWNVVKRIKFANERIFGATRKAAPDATIDLIEGNHEARLLRQLADATPAMRAVLADLHGWTLSKLFGLEAYEVNYVAKANLAAWTQRDHKKELGNNYKVYYDAFLAHHFPHARNMGLPGVNGHHHRHQVWPMFSAVYGAYEWHQLGCGHLRSASYCEGEAWHTGFALVHIDTHTKAVNIEYVPVTDHAVVGGKWYVREDAERVIPDSRIKLASASSQVVE